MRRDGHFFLLKSLFEDLRAEDMIFVNTRVVRTTEALLHAQRLYDRLGVDQEATVFLRSTYRGLAGRCLGFSNQAFFRGQHCSQENESSIEIEFRLRDVEDSLVDFVEKLVSPLFVLFDFYQVDRTQLEQWVNDFVAGRLR